MKKTFLALFLLGSLHGDEYDFDMNSIEQKPYEYSGYLRLDEKAQRLNGSGEEYQNQLRLEGLLDFSYDYEDFSLKSSFMGTRDYVDETFSQSSICVNDFYVEKKLNANHSFLVGKESLAWGKGYFYNPVAFFDRPKDPMDPTQAREGFFMAKYGYNKSFQGELKNLSFDVAYLPSRNEINRDYGEFYNEEVDSNNMAMRLYALAYDTDFDLIYSHSNVESDKIGFDFSKNLQTNFEIHGEYANVLDAGNSYLLGLRYLTEFELTITSEYLYFSDGLNEEELQTSSLSSPFMAKDYLVTLFSQKNLLTSCI